MSGLIRKFSCGRRLIMDRFCRSVCGGGRARALSSSPSSVGPLPLTEESLPPLESLTSKPSPLWLLVHSEWLDEDPDFGDHYPYRFVSLKDEKLYKLDKIQVPSQRRLPWDRAFFFPDDTEIHGTTSFGWVLTVHQDSLKMFLVNPLFPTDCIVPLPPLHHSYPDIVGGCVTKIPQWYYTDQPYLQKHYVSFRGKDPYGDYKAVYIRYTPSLHPEFAMSSPPSDPNFTIALNEFGHLHFWRPGRKSWVGVEEPEGYGNLVYSKANKCFYAIQSFQNVDAWEWPPESPEPRMRTRFEIKMDWDEPRHQESSYLVESASGRHLYLVHRFAGSRLIHGRVQYYVYRMDFDEEEQKHKWQRIKCLGDESNSSALLLGRSYGFCVRVDEFPELKPNCIYFTDNSPTDRVERKLPVDMQVFDMEDDSITSHSFCFSSEENHLQKRTSLPGVWLFPNAIP